MTGDVSKAGSVARSRAIVAAAYRALRANPRLIWFPVLSGVAGSLLLLVGLAFAGLGDVDDGEARALSVGGVFVYVAGHLLSVFSGVAMTHAALEALAGRPWTVRESFAVANSRRRTVATYALVAATVGHILRGSSTTDRGRRKGRKRRRPRKRRGLLQRAAGLAWWAATYLALPVIARERRGGIGTIQRSASLMKSTWKEMVVARLTLWWAWIPVVFAGALPALLCALFGVREPAMYVAAGACAVFLFGAFGLLLGTLESIYRAALYAYATEGVVPDAFAATELETIWHAAPSAYDVEEPPQDVGPAERVDGTGDPGPDTPNDPDDNPDA